MKSMLYTRTGDSGTTSLVGGTREPKNSVRLEAYGTVDEFSSFLGLVLSSPDCPRELKGQLLEIQNLLFDLGCYLATPADQSPVLRGIHEDFMTRLEGWIDALDEQTPKANAFVLPGGAMVAAHAHVARTVCRRTERRILDLSAEAPLDPLAIRFMNRLSDYLFIAARWLNFMTGIAELKWEPAGK